MCRLCSYSVFNRLDVSTGMKRSNSLLCTLQLETPTLIHGVDIGECTTIIFMPVHVCLCSQSD